MSNIAIQVENLSKAYQLGEIGTGTISRDIERWWAKMRGKEDPFLRIGEINDRTAKSSENDVVWSLKDINFEIEQGQAVGIIGRNGAGKSTLLKILSRVTSPTTGSIRLKGRVASLLEVGTGFHPELTGRENIFLNGAILGMRKAEIIRKFDEIVDFAGVERYIDTPVKRYSSGMYVRLAFAVAAHLESEILIVDEVLAVGDAEFQKKCLGKMGDVSSKEGRTVLFVSHNMGAVKSLCQTGILLKNGEVQAIGDLEIVVEKYVQNISSSNTTKVVWAEGNPGNEFIKLIEAKIVDYTGNEKSTLKTTEKFFLKFQFSVNQNNLKFIAGCRVTNSEDIEVFYAHDINTKFVNEVFNKGKYEVSFTIPKNLLNEGRYNFSVACFTTDSTYIHFFEKDILSIEMEDPSDFTSTKGQYHGRFPGLIRPYIDCKIDNI